ncbi:helix-turn-helix transcriptional regulator [Clostridium perfringens]|nr:helix-turn-helix transcriptional regulator [Clostridium perfringens]ELC8374601.1 helix-turn-helix transcriptional regulator [Clostridium perfringens]MDJ9034467.1 helix-turn-helix transcriptional regulator [Clostridium perfringens]MDK0409750.1 helix-turn-helix transcriptional regulator [Clostridium perfringens]MDK0444712.1 helix-turn-helix transcriptional regulator [Clostridium perfringens]
MGFNNKLKELRKEKNISQEQLAKELNISRQAISKWESGVSQS